MNIHSMASSLELILILFCYVHHCFGCVRTSDIGTTTTTTAEPSVCTGCKADAVNFTSEGDDPQSHPPEAEESLQGGCSVLTITCRPMSPNENSLLTFQGGLGGPAPGAPSQAVLSCNSMGQWTYSGFDANQPTTVITDAYCLG